jgi:signal transduction histidine kinase/GGDEF domain-containing protein
VRGSSRRAVTPRGDRKAADRQPHSDLPRAFDEPPSRLTLLAEAASQLAGETQPDEVVRLALAHACGVTGAARAYVGLAYGDRILVRGPSAVDRAEVRGVWFDLSEGAHGHALAIAPPFLSSRGDDPLLRQLAAMGMPARAALCAPLLGHQSQLTGCLLACDPSVPFDEECLAWFGILASLVAAALESARGLGDLDQHGQTLVTQRAALRAIAAQLTMAEERERRHIAADLHDRLGQLLALAAMTVERAIETGETAEQKEILGALRERLKEALDETRTLEFDLSPPVLQESGLAAALEWLVGTCDDASSAHCVFRCHGSDALVVEEVRAALFRAGRELFINALKHSGASHISVDLRDEPGQTVIEVTDDGCGLPQGGAHEGFGLIAVRERLTALGGTLAVDSAKMGGTLARVSLPLRSGRSSVEDGGASLPQRRNQPAAFLERLAAEAGRAVHEGAQLALCVFSFSGLGAFVEAHGYHAGSLLLEQLGAIVGRAVAETGDSYRIDIDAVAALLLGSGAAGAQALALRVEAELARDGAGCEARLACGIAALPTHALDADELLRFAEEALDEARVDAGERIIVYDAALTEALGARRSAEEGGSGDRRDGGEAGGGGNDRARRLRLWASSEHR